MLTALTLATLLSALPTGSAKLSQGAAVEIGLRLTSFETERVALPKRGTFTSVELLYRASTGERLDLRFVFRGAGELPAKNVLSVSVQTKVAGASSWTPAKKTGCRVKLYRATADEITGKVDCAAPENGEPFDASFDAKR